MKTILRLFALCLLLLTNSCTPFAQSYSSLWSKVEDAQRKGLPQTVIKLTDEIYRKAKREKEAGQLFKAYLLREQSQEELTPDSFYTRLPEMEEWIKLESNALNRNILHSLLAEEYANMLSQNRYALNRLTDLDIEELPTDMREWGLTQFIEKADYHALASVNRNEQNGFLRASTKEYTPFVEPEEDSNYFNHELYELLNRRAIDVYEEFRGFGMDSLMNARIDSLYRQKVKVYDAKPKVYGANSKVYDANSKVYDAKPEGGLLASLHYLSWRKQRGTNPMSDEAYLQALDELLAKYRAYPLAAEIYLRKAELMSERKRISEAIRLCEEGIKHYPNYNRINSIKNYRAEKLQPQLQLWADESAYPGDSLAIRINSRNIKRFSIWLYSTGMEEVPYLEDGIDEKFRREHARLLTTTYFDITPTPQEGVAKEDLQHLDLSHEYRLPVPDSLGVYLMEVVADEVKMKSSWQFLTTTRFKVLVMNLKDDQAEVVTLDAKSGQPIGEATVSFYTWGGPERRRLLSEVQTDNEGKALISKEKDFTYYIARKADDRAMLQQRFSHWQVSGGYKESKPQAHLTLLTDRALYRPGQTIHIKGVSYEQWADSAHVLPNKNYEVRLLDVNRKEVEKKHVRTNEFGSFTTEFTLPTSVLNGTFVIETADASTTIQVEEYKRPTFELTFDPVKQAYALGDTIQMSGQVKALTGIAIQGVPLVYSIFRWDSDSWWTGRTNKPIATHSVRLDAAGRFSFPVALTPANEDCEECSYNFIVEIGVTTETGETQTSMHKLLASTKPYKFSHSLPEVVCKEDALSAIFTITNAANLPLTAKGMARLYPIINGETASQPAYTGSFTSDEKRNLKEWRTLPSGEYRLVLSAIDRHGRELSNKEESANLILFSLNDKLPPCSDKSFVYEKRVEFDETNDGEIIFGTPYKDTYLLINLLDDTGKRIESRTMLLSNRLTTLRYPYRKAYGKGASLLLAFVKEGKLESHTIQLKKRQPQRTLEMKWEVFRDKLRPGQTEEWKLSIKTPQGIPASAELLATLYDASLDQLYKRDQSLRLFFNTFLPTTSWQASYFDTMYNNLSSPQKEGRVRPWGFDHLFTTYRMLDIVFEEEIAVNEDSSSNRVLMSTRAAHAAPQSYKSSDVAEAGENLPEAGASLRTNFAETAFFYPQLRTNEQGEIVFSFTVPESLTRWNFRGYAHTREMMTGRLDASVVTAKEFMLTPNLPRFVRVGDKTQIVASIANQSDKQVKGNVTLTLFDPMTERIILKQKQKFSAGAKRSIPVTFTFEATDKYELLGVRLIADGGAFSDGEQHVLPVLSNKERITETLALPIRGSETRTFDLKPLFNNDSPTTTDRRLTVEFTANPAWYAVQALPTLTMPDNDNALSWATVYYANALAAHIANSNPHIRPVLEAWKASEHSTETLRSKLEQNEELKNILLAETPWLLDATTESEQMQRLSLLFDTNHLRNLDRSAIDKLRTLQAEDGSWSWFKGMPGSRYITAYITELLTRLSLLTGETTDAALNTLRAKAMEYLHKAALKEYNELKKLEKEGIKPLVPSEAAMDWLYLTTLNDEEVPAAYLRARTYLYKLVRNNLAHGTLRTKARSAIILKDDKLAADFLASIREHLIVEEEQGAHFAFLDAPYRWGMLPIPTHVAAIEALAMDKNNATIIEEMKQWLLKQKQATAWNSPVATADAIYALLLRGDNLLESEHKVRISLGKSTWTNTTNNPLGYIKQTFTDDAPELSAPTITVEKQGTGMAWGAVYAQYLSPIADVSEQGGALSISKQLYIERTATNGKKTLQPITSETKLQVGDKVVSRLTLRLDRAMDFLQLTDRRAACLEPLATLSGYRWSSGFDYYTEVEDSGCNFFFDHLGKGVYILEHSCRIVRPGTYQDGLATLQSAYAPEFAAHSAGSKLKID